MVRIKHVPQPGYSGPDKDPGQPATVAHVHEEEDHQQSFGHGNGERHYHAQGTPQVQARDPPGQQRELANRSRIHAIIDGAVEQRLP